MVVQQAKDLQEAVNILQPFAMHLKSLSNLDLPAIFALNLLTTNMESAETKKLDSKNIYEISFEHAECGKVKKSHPKPFPQNYNSIPLKHSQAQFDAILKLSNLCKGISKPCGFLKVLNTSQSGTSTVEQLPF